MAEGSTATGAGQRTGTRRSEQEGMGRPYYEKLRKDLKTNIAKKMEIDERLAQIEADIAQQEDDYLEQTSAAGNIIRGFDNYIKASASATTTSSGPGTSTRRKGGISEQDKIFSNSSVSWTPPTSPPLTINASAANAGRTKSALETARTESGVGSARETPTSTGGGTKKNKKKGAADKEKEEADGDERPYKRGKVSWGRE